MWIDEIEIKLGDSLRQKIDEGLRTSRFGVVILSPAFFKKHWTQWELDGLADREMSSGVKVILPIWHEVHHDDVAAHSPSLAEKHAARMSDGIERVADEVADVLRASGGATREIESMPRRRPAKAVLLRKVRRHRRSLIIALIVGAMLATGSPWWWSWLSPHTKSATHQTTQTTQSSVSASGVLGFSGACAPYQIYAQNRWAPYGTAVRTGPDVRLKQISNFDGNHSIAVDGWVHSSIPYPTNSPPWNSDIWFHLADNSGWVSFAGVRGVPTIHDPRGKSAEGGIPAPTPARCQGAVQ